MSIFTSIQRLNERIRYLEKHTACAEEKKVKLQEEIDFLWQLKHALLFKTHTKDYTTLNQEIHKIKDYERKIQPKKLAEDLNWVLQDLQNISKIESSKYYRNPEGGTTYALVKQSQNGNESGNCYGYTSQMADPKANPFFNPGKYRDKNGNLKFLPLTHQGYRFQQNQLIANLDQNIVKTKKIGTKYSNTNFAEQAAHLLKVAKKNNGKHLRVSLRSANGSGHAVYLRRDNNAIYYMDSNDNAVKFHQEKHFIKYYTELAEKYKPSFEIRWLRVSAMSWDPENNHKRSKTLLGKTLAWTFGALLGGIIGAAICTFLLPGIGTAVGAMAGASFGSSLSTYAMKKLQSSSRKSPQTTINMGSPLNASTAKMLRGLQLDTTQLENAPSIQNAVTTTFSPSPQPIHYKTHNTANFKHNERMTEVTDSNNNALTF